MNLGNSIYAGLGYVALSTPLMEEAVAAARDGNFLPAIGGVGASFLLGWIIGRGRGKELRRDLGDAFGPSRSDPPPHHRAGQSSSDRPPS